MTQIAGVNPYANWPEGPRLDWSQAGDHLVLRDGDGMKLDETSWRPLWKTEQDDDVGTMLGLLEDSVSLEIGGI